MNKEIKRQGIHFLAGNLTILFFLASKLYGIDTFSVTGFMLGALLIGTGFSLRIQKGHHIPMLSSLIKDVEREDEKYFPGKPAFLLLIGSILTIALFEPLPAITGLIVLTYGDTIATLIGKYRGKIQLISNRTLEGTMAGIILSTAILLFFIPWHKTIGIAAVGMLAEYLPIDDNIGIPLVTALAASMLL